MRLTNCLRKTGGAITAYFLVVAFLGWPELYPQSPFQDIPGMSLIAAGDYWMGRVHFFPVDSVALFERDREDDYPAHKVYLDAFYIDKYEVNNDDYASFVTVTGRAKPWHWKDGKVPKGEDRFPIYNVNWNDAEAYCKWAGKRLPTEAEWEKAARGSLDRKAFPWGDIDNGAASTHANTNSVGPLPVGSFPPNNYGLYDMVGNVWEWLQDWYERNYYSVSPRRNPQGPDEGLYKVIRGGGWSDIQDKNVMNHFRNFQDPEQGVSTLGFRCAKSIANTP